MNHILNTLKFIIFEEHIKISNELLSYLITHINPEEYIIDENGNLGCVNCIDCHNCIMCYGCSHCKDCVACQQIITARGCVLCFDCDTILTSDNLLNSRNSINCSHCNNLNGCVDCYKCEDCFDCKKCRDCINCQNCNHLKHEVNLSDYQQNLNINSPNKSKLFTFKFLNVELSNHDLEILRIIETRM